MRTGWVGPITRVLAMAVSACLALLLAGPSVATAADWEVEPPGAPTDLTLTDLGGAIRATWEPAFGGGEPSAYNVRLNEGAWFPTVEPAYTFEGVAPGWNTVTVFALNDIGISQQVTASLFVQTGPGAPTAVTATQVGRGIELDWQPPVTGSTPVGYRVTLDGANGVNLGPDARTHTFADVLPGPHTVAVAAVGSTTVGVMVPVSLIVVGTPAAPTGLVLTQTGSGVKADWVAPGSGPAPTGYLVSLDGGSPVPVTATTHTFAFAPPGTRTISVRATNVAGPGDPLSASLTVVSLPDAPTGLTVTQDGPGVTLSWTPADAGGVPAGYKVSLDGGVPVTVTGTSRTYPSLPGGSHTFTVRAFNAAGDGPSATRSFQVLTKPGAPVRAGATRQGTGLYVSWDLPATGSAPSSYRITLDGGQPVTLPSSPRSHTFPAVSGGPHTITLVAVNAAGEGPAVTVSVPAAVTPTRPGKPWAVTATRGPRGKPLTVKVAWQPAAAPSAARVTGYRVLASKVVAGKVVRTRLTPVLPGTARSRKVRLGAGRWRFQVQAVNSAGWGDWSARTPAVRPR